ncbi:beta-galactosidase [Deinococcus hopiensis]|uniref:Beta-galactosidase n=1 Tax=Deinococcus hopiensis KR-140 TaxID=695939 RepID=A0A1W1UQY9_9DEIO|nr:beta-galactosidase [Deinococcus hopiensis]SMB83429.1 beta-galactosidase [Deinococcus hopiensis KR-140]
MTQTDHLFLAVCDYPEHVPEDRWRSYARQQRELGLTFVRMAEFAWSRMEPRPGEYDWAWLDRAVEAYHAEGMRVVLCTPTATPPAWLIRAHPEILAHDTQGRVREFGSRRHYDFASPVYREHSRRITWAIAERYGQHPAVVGWQTDNEFGCHNTGRSYGGASAAAFPDWLAARYGTLDALNAAWGNVFWSMEYSGWAQIRPPNLTVTAPNPSHVLDYARFASAQIRDFQAQQVAVLRELSPGRFVTHNFMIFESGFDHYEVARGLDFATWDNYPTGMLEFFAPPGTAEEVKLRYARSGHPDLVSFNHDLYRCLVKAQDRLGREGRSSPNGFWVMEQQCGQVNWAPHNPLPADGAVQLWTAQAWAHGADVVSYFRWRAATMAQEVMHSGLLRHDETPDRGHAEVQRLDATQFPTGNVSARVALLHDYESLWILDEQTNGGPTYWAQTLAYYTALRSLGLDVDVLHPDDDLAQYVLVVAPALTLIPERRLQKLQADAEERLFVFGPRTGFRTESGCAYKNGQFGHHKDFFGVRCLNFESLRPGLTVRVGDHQAAEWTEGYELLGNATALTTYGSGPLRGQVAAVRNGNAVTIGAHAPGLIGEILQTLAAEVDLTPVLLPEGVRSSRRAGRTLIENWNPEEVQVSADAIHAITSSGSSEALTLAGTSWHLL